MKRIILLVIVCMLLANGANAKIIREIQVNDDAEQEDIMDTGQTLPEVTTNDLTVTELKELAAKNDISAILALGDRYYYGKGGVQRDRAQAFKWYKMAALQDNIAAQFSVGHMYRTGSGVKVNMQKAVEWFEKAADQGDTESQFMAGEIYGLGSEVPKDTVKAYKWYRIALNNMEPRFKGIIKAELELLGKDMTKAEVAAAEKMAAEWQKTFAQRQKDLAQN